MPELQLLSPVERKFRTPARLAPAALVTLVLGVAGTPTVQSSAPAAAGPGEAGGSTITRGRFLMGTVFTFEAPTGEDPVAVADALEAALDEVDRLEAILSNWQETSELSRINREAARGPVPVSQDLYRAVAASLRWADETAGAFDPTVEPLTRFFRGHDGAPARLGAWPRRSGGAWRRVILDPVGRTIRFRRGVGGLDLGGIGKGYALDRAAEVLRIQRVPAALLDAGGQVLALGAPPGEPGWEVGVADPSDRLRPAVPLRLREVSAATSGNSERPGEILDPNTGMPVGSRGSATAIAPDATAADALSTALFVMGPERGVAWAGRRADVVALYLEPPPPDGGCWRVLGAPALPPGGGFLLEVDSATHHGRRFLNVQLW